MTSDVLDDMIDAAPLLSRSTPPMHQPVFQQGYRVAAQAIASHTFSHQFFKPRLGGLEP